MAAAETGANVMAYAENFAHPPTVLVVEDEFIIALDLSDTVQDLGYNLQGPFPDKAKAFAAIERTLPDAAILDVHIADGEVFPLADALVQAGVPIIFHSGHYQPDVMEKRYPGAVACSKPCSPGELTTVLKRVVG